MVKHFLSTQDMIKKRLCNNYDKINAIWNDVVTPSPGCSENKLMC